MDESRPDGPTLAGFFAIVVFIGLNFVAVRQSNAELAPFWGAALRYLVATVLIFALVALRRVPLPKGAALRASMLFGTLNFAVFFGLIYWALVEVPAGAASVVLAAVPLFTYLIAIGYRMESFAWRSLVGAVIVIVGIGVISLQGGGAGGPPLRMAAVVVAAVAAAAAGIVIKRAPRTHPLAMNAIGMATGGVLLMGITLLAGDPIILPQQRATQWAVGYLILITIALFVLLVWVLGRWTASGVAYSTVLAPIVTVIAGHLILDEPITVRLLAGGLLVFVGVYLGALRRRSPQPVPAPGEPAARPVKPRLR